MRDRTGHPPPPGADHLQHPAPPSRAEVPVSRNNVAELPDRLLAVRAAEGDDDAFAVLVRRHTSRLLALAHHLLGSQADAEDAVQEAFLAAWRQLPEFRQDASFGTWMYRIVTNRCLNILRRAPRALPLDTVPEPTAHDPGSSPPCVAETDAATAALAQALHKLSPEQRACWVLRELHGLHYEEIAHVTGTSEQTVRGRLFRARHALQEAMRPWR
ncbi:RNA polymerase sigma factor [Streptomyces agglomeratus]|uniref:RNA polymerase sigma factor n=1 Tax=Streptomyces agglomeratus TaxID=285458 RepID=UPI0009A01BD1|nr:sigma-70 family RNA polymerase sigma factor [Streptomyces agglomeratus]